MLSNIYFLYFFFPYNWGKKKAMRRALIQAGLVLLKKFVGINYKNRDRKRFYAWDNQTKK